MHGSASCRPEAVPSGAVPDVARVLQAASWYAVLEVGPSATVEEIRRAHKVKSLVTHPDKLGGRNHGAHEASIRVNTVCCILRTSPHFHALPAPHLHMFARGERPRSGTDIASAEEVFIDTGAGWASEWQTMVFRPR